MDKKYLRVFFVALCCFLFGKIAYSQGGIGFHKETFTFKQINDCDIKADVYRVDDGETHPVIVWIHGGALMFGSREYLKEHQLKLYLNSGYTVVAIDYRLAPETKLEEIVIDIKDALEWVREEGPDLFNIDPKRIAAVGHSAGGYLAQMTGHCLEIPPKAIVSFYGYGDIIGDWYAKPDSFYCSLELIDKDVAYNSISDSVISEASFNDRYDFYLYCRQNGLWPEAVSGRNPFKDKDWYNYYCPVKNITENYPPTLLLHGTDDTDVPFEQSVLMDSELELNGVPHKLIKMDGYGHIFDNPRNAFDDPIISNAFEEVLRFLKKELEE
jgi:acetyl esterase/lipase